MLRNFLKLGMMVLFILSLTNTESAAPTRTKTEGFFYYQCALKNLQITEGQLKEPLNTTKTSTRSSWDRQQMWQDFMQPYVVTSAGDEVYLYIEKNRRDRYNDIHDFTSQRSLTKNFVVVRSRDKKIPEGILFLPKKDFSGMYPVGFRFPAQQQDPQQTAELKRNFYNAKQYHYQQLYEKQLIGGSWYRYQMESAKASLASDGNGKKIAAPDDATPPSPESRDQEDMQETFAVFSGGRSLSENLQLDRTLRITGKDKETVPLNSLKGITTAEMDWTQETEGLNPKKDTLAAFTPHDQYGLFFPSFKAMTDLIDEIDKRGTPIVQTMDPRAEDALTRFRYQQQLCLPTSELSRLLGPPAISGTAFTGSDPYFRTGTDLAVLFETNQAEFLLRTFASKRKEAGKKIPGCKPVSGEINGIPYSGLVSPQREVCSYAAQLGNNVVVVSNSLFQLKQISAVYKKKAPALSSLAEYTFFRDRYKVSDPKEAAFLLLSDAAIRKWCSPKWRIGNSRRTRAAAEMMHKQAELLATHKGENAQPVTSETYGNLEFLTPIAELQLEKVSPQEAKTYEWFRQNYQNNYSKFFDPIAIRFTVEPKRIGMDLSIRPLIADTQYASAMSITGNNAVTQISGDRHQDALIHFLFSLDPKSEPVMSAGNLLAQIVPKLGTSGLNWLGEWIAFYMDRDPFWKELEAAQQNDGDNGTDKFMEKNVNRFPAALVVDVRNPLTLSVFLSGLRAFVEQTAPGLTHWENLTYNSQSYVRITAAESSQNRSSAWKMELFYAPTPDELLFTISEKLLKAYLDRKASNKRKTAEDQTLAPWLGKSMCFTARDPILDVLRILYGAHMKTAAQRMAWENIYILNEWKRRFNVKSAVDFHRRYWHTKLICPGGGEYVWNETYRTYQSTEFGHPGQPKEDTVFNDPLYNVQEVNLGLTFEGNGLRAQGVLIRKE